jgi:ferrochelatase
MTAIHVPGAASAPPYALVVLNMGGPDGLDAVQPFLRNLLADPFIVSLPWPLSLVQGKFADFVSRRRAPKVAEGYRVLGGGSPLLCWSELQAIKSARAATELGVPCKPFVAMRYWKPFADETVAAIRAVREKEGLAGIVVLSLYPQFSRATTETSLIDFREALVRGGLAEVPRYEIDRWPELPGYLDATADSVRRALPAGPPYPYVLFSAHGLPESYVKRGDPYRDEIERTYRGVLARLPKGPEYGLSFQSKVGPAAWLKPYTDAAVEALAARGVRDLLMVPLAFVSDHIETTYEMDVLYGDLARERGMKFARVPALNGDEALCRALGAAVAERVRGRAEACA